MKKTVLIFLFFVCFAKAFAQPTLFRYANNPVVNNTLDQSSSTTYSPNVIYKGGKYHMWYTRKVGKTEKIGYMTSSDGLAWVLVDSLVLTPTTSTTTRFDSKKLGQPSVILDNDTLKMWYWGGGINNGNIGYAWSLDGIAWTKFDGAGTGNSVYDLVMDGTGALALTTPNVLKVGNTYHMWYSTLALDPGVKYKISYATSVNGKNWTKVPGIGTGGSVLGYGAPGKFDEIGVLFPSVVKSTTGYEMWYTGSDPAYGFRIGYANSVDGVNWIRKDGPEAKGSFFEDGSSSSIMLEEGNIYKLWYSTAAKSVNYASTSQTTNTESAQTILDFKNVPNPFNGQTEISYNIVNSNSVVLKVYDVLGKEITTLVNEFQNSGNHIVNFDGNNLRSGIYYCRLEIGKELSATKKMVK